ncbi:MAG: LOG family protein [Alphaproteobacteria bacterium]|nr:LOG family protein [Alphaproteobacteria bacterium]
MIEIDALDVFDRWARAPREPAAVQGLDLRDRRAALEALRCPGTLFLACRLDPHVAGHLVQHGAIVVPDLDGRAATVHRSRLYAPEELYDVFDPERPESFHDCLDQRIYRQFLLDGKGRPADISVGLWQGLHDHSISDALLEVLEGRRVVSVMGGHGMERRDPGYAVVVRLAKKLAQRGYLMVSGGGPGAMEATHLGAWLAGRPDSAVDEVLAGPFAERPEGARAGAEYADPDWLVRAWRVREAWPRVTDTISVGIPTWLYGHEPPTPFATHIAKYFANSIREDGVLAVASHGVVFAPGSAGTIQEIFQDACQNHYGTTGAISPMILLDRHYWTHDKPVWSLLSTMADGPRYGELLALVDTCDEVVQQVQRYEPSWYRVEADPHAALEVELRRALKLRDNWSIARVEGDAAPSARAWCGMGDAARAADWLFAVGGDDWIDRDAAIAFWEARLETEAVAVALVRDPRPPRPLVSRDLLAVRIGGHEQLWSASLAD